MGMVQAVRHSESCFPFLPRSMSEDRDADSAPSRSEAPNEAEQDVRWMQRVAQGDIEAFERLIEAHQTRVVGTVAKMLGDETDSEDIAQQVFIRVWKSAGR